MTSFRFREAPVALRRIVEEAVRVLGYFRPDAVDDLARQFEQRWPQGVGAKMLLGPDRRFDPLLSEKGARDPDHAARATALRVVCNVRKAEFEAKMPEMLRHTDQVMLWVRAGHVCSIMAGRDETVFPWSASPVLPQPSCDREWCPCHFTAYFEAV